MVNKSSCSFSRRVWRRRRMTVCCSCRDTASGICFGKMFRSGKLYLPWNVDILDKSNSKYLCTIVAAHICSLAVSAGSWDAGREQAQAENEEQQLHHFPNNWGSHVLTCEWSRCYWWVSVCVSLLTQIPDTSLTDCIPSPSLSPPSARHHTFHLCRDSAKTNFDPMYSFWQTFLLLHKHCRAKCSIVSYVTYTYTWQMWLFYIFIYSIVS